MSEHGYGLPDGWLDLAAFMYVSNSLANDAAARQRRYWAAVDENERHILIDAFNNHRQRMNDSAARWHAEKEFFEDRRSRFVGYFRKAPGYKWRWALPRAFAGFFAICAFTNDNRPAYQFFWFALAMVAAITCKFVHDEVIPGYADAYLAQEIKQAKYDNDVSAFEQAHDGYTQVGW